MKRKTIILVLVLVVAAVGIVGGLALQNRKKDSTSPAGGESIAAVVSGSSGNSDTITTEEKDGSVKAVSAEDPSLNPEAVQSDSSNSPGTVEEGSSSGSGEDIKVGPLIWNGNNSTNGDQNTEQPATNAVSFPYTIPNSSLTVQSITSYDGYFLEDGSDEDVSGITVILLSNSGSTPIEYAEVTMNRDGTQLMFQASDLPAGASVAVQEANRTAYADGTYIDVNATCSQLDSLEMSADKVTVTDNGDNSLTVENISDADIPGTRLFYKLYMNDQNVYLGGITYTVKLNDLKAGESQTITPSHYQSGSAKVMMVRTYDTEQ